MPMQLQRRLSLRTCRARARSRVRDLHFSLPTKIFRQASLIKIVSDDRIFRPYSRQNAVKTQNVLSRKKLYRREGSLFKVKDEARLIMCFLLSFWPVIATRRARSRQWKRSYLATSEKPEAFNFIEYSEEGLWGISCVSWLLACTLRLRRSAPRMYTPEKRFETRRRTSEKVSARLTRGKFESTTKTGIFVRTIPQ